MTHLRLFLFAALLILAGCSRDKVYLTGPVVHDTLLVVTPADTTHHGCRGQGHGHDHRH